MLRAFEQALARRGQPDAALDAIEQQKSQFLLKELDLPRQRRLRDAKSSLALRKFSRRATWMK